MPTPRLSAGCTASGMLITRSRTKTVASAPSPSTTRPSGAGRSKPYARRITIATTAKPMKNTSFPSAPVCHPITASFTPGPEPAYQSIRDESIRTRPETHAIRSPEAQIPSGAGGPYDGGGGPAGF